MRSALKYIDYEKWFKVNRLRVVIYGKSTTSTDLKVSQQRAVIESESTTRNYFK